MLGTIVVVLLQSGVSLLSNAWLLYVGVLFIVMVMYAPGGLIGLIYMHMPIWRAGRLRELALPYARVLPPALLVTVAGLALLGSMASATGAAVAAEKERFAAAGTLAVTVSGVTLMGVGSAFWGLCFGLLVMGVERLLRR